MSALALFERYRANHRRLEPDGFSADRFDHLVRYTATDAGTEGMIVFAQLRAGHERAQIEEQMAYFRALRQDFEWSVYGFDRPDNLQELLLARGFIAGAAETFMLRRLPDAAPAVPPPTDMPWHIRRIDDEAGVRDVSGRGLYSALYRCRHEEAARRACAFLSVDATALSRPILQRLGFKAICAAVPMRWGECP